MPSRARIIGLAGGKKRLARLASLCFLQLSFKKPDNILHRGRGHERRMEVQLAEKGREMR